MRFTPRQVIISSAFASALLMAPLTGEASELKPGMSNEQVKELQELLKAKGFFTYHTTTGYFGPITEKAVKEFQASVHLTPTGIVDKVTYEKLKSSVAISLPKYYAGNVLKIGAKGENVSVLQSHLKTLGYFTYPKITGYYGSVTAEAVKRFQKAYGLKADGVVNSQTLKKIQEAVQQKNKPQSAPKQNEKGTNSSLVLKLGTKGKEVSQLQLHLKTLGYFQYPTITDYYGIVTSDAVKKFQKKNGLTVTGIADSLTLEKIRQAIEQKEKSQASEAKQGVYLTIGSIGEQVKQVQTKLKQLGYFTYPAITGYYGSATAEAVKQFQKSVQLQPTGAVDQQTYERLMGKQPFKKFDPIELIADASELLGIPYVWGGEKPETGFDCSGFLVYVFKKQGISLPRTVATIWKVGKPVHAPSVGDVVFFETYQPGASHAGIYIGNNQFIHSGGTNGVSISRLDNPYWSQRYLGAKRYY
ncbi:MAG TPA: peptidoglycan-binding protein [Anoxybacillus sp.]|nr:peptidoglycan-binding protein [Anoxybacillus sp.]